MECDQLLAAGCNLIHARCAKLLTLRAKAGLLATLPAHDFLSLVNAVEGFIRSSTQITGLSCPQLRAALLTQARTFLDTFHDNCKRNLRWVWLVLGVWSKSSDVMYDDLV